MSTKATLLARTNPTEITIPDPTDKRITDEIRSAVWAFGWRQMCADAAAGKEGQAAVDAVLAKHKALLDGKVPTSGASGSPERGMLVTILIRHKILKQKEVKGLDTAAIVKLANGKKGKAGDKALAYVKDLLAKEETLAL